jgi:hypothetical protein
MQAKPITDQTYILMTDSAERFGLLQIFENKVVLITSDTKNEFNSLRDLEDLISDRIHLQQPVELGENQVNDIDGFPVRHAEVYDVHREGDQISYRASPNSSVRWTAGWFGILFSRGFITFLCPKPSSLNENKFVGPFKTKMEVDAAVKIENHKMKEE